MMIPARGPEAETVGRAPVAETQAQEEKVLSRRSHPNSIRHREVSESDWRAPSQEVSLADSLVNSIANVISSWELWWADWSRTLLRTSGRSIERRRGGRGSIGTRGGAGVQGGDEPPE